MNWTDGRKKGFITSLIRAGFRRWPPKYECLNAAKMGKKINKATGRMAEHYKCNACKKHFVAKDVQVDHIDPVVDPKVGFVDWNTFIERLLCSLDNLQVLCTGCHSIKTRKEKDVRVGKAQHDRARVESPTKRKEMETKTPRKTSSSDGSVGKKQSRKKETN